MDINKDTPEKLISDFAEWSKKYARGTIYSFNAKIDEQLIALEERAKNLAALQPSTLPLIEDVLTFDDLEKAYDAGVKRGESYISGWGYENSTPGWDEFIAEYKTKKTMIPIFCPECGIGLSNSEKNVCFCQNCHATWDKPEGNEGGIPAKVECTEEKDLHQQVVDHIRNYNLFDWEEALSDNEMSLLEDMFMSFNPLCPRGSIGFEEQKRHIQESVPLIDKGEPEAVQLLLELIKKMDFPDNISKSDYDRSWEIRNKLYDLGLYPF